MSDFRAMNKPSGIQNPESEIIRVLLIEDNPGDARLVREMLVETGTNKFNLEHVERISQGLIRLSQEDFQVILLDLSLPDGHGLETVDRVCNVAPYVPVLVLTGLDDETLAIRAVQEGAQDYLIKGQMNSNLLVRALRYAIERKQAEESLRESEETARALVNATNDSVFLIDTSGTILALNEITAKKLGKTVDEMVGSHLYDSLPPEVAKRRKAYLDQAFRTGKAVYFEDERQGIWFDTCAYPILDAKGKVARLAIYGRDITERKHAEKAIRQSEEKFRQLFDEAPVGYFECDSQGRITNVNRTELEMLGYTSEEMIGQPLWKFVVEEEEARNNILVRLAGTLPPARSIERTYRRKDGATFPVLIENRVLRDSEGRIIGMRSTIQDITERKHAEEEKRVLEEQLRQSQKMESIGRLTGGIAHDFNNFLTIIKGYSQLSLLELKEDSPLKGNIEEINRATDQSADLIRQLLAFSRRQVMEMRVLDLNILLQNLNKMLRRVIGEDIELVMHLPEDLGGVKTDHGQIEQVIMNLAVNAKDAMPSGGKLTIETANVELDEAYARRHVAVAPGRYVMLSISDTGVGMTPEVRDRVFEPFFTTKEEGKGTGLGLSTVYGIVKQSGGNIWIYSELGKGTTLKIYLPRVDEPLEEIEETTAAKNGLPRGSETILVVEDEEEVRKLVVRGLEGQEYRVLDAPQGLDAFLIAEEHQGPIHLLVTDVVMPKVNGCELAERIASIRPGIKVLYMSGYTDNAIAHHGILDKGMNFLQKPFTVDGLTRKVREVLDR
jgi:two-component system cell cycle sensor histidine kinase/response regulator CckA